MTMQADVNEMCRHSIPHRPIGRVRHTHRDCVALEAVGHFIIEPRLVSKLDRVSRALPVPQTFDKVLQPIDIFFQKCRKLPDHRGEPSSQRRCRFATTNHCFSYVEQLFVVGDVTVPFDGKRKSCRGLVAPFLKGAFLLEPVERAVHLDGAETFRTETEPSFLRRVAVEAVAPAFIIPAAGADVCFAGHYFSLSISKPRVVA